VWDSGILEKHDRDARHYAERLNAWVNALPEGAFVGGTVLDWAMESHRIAKEEEYYRTSVPVVDQQLAKAGVRLAKVLNDALGKR
jgi:hypothetical protein